MSNNRFDGVAAVLDDIRVGKLVIVLDDDDREGEGDLIGAACHVSAETINFMISHGRGAFIAVFTPHGWCEQLQIPAMAGDNDSFNQTQFRVAVDARSGGSGSSASDRALTVRLLGSADAVAADFVRPGHVVPIAAHPQGLAARRGHTEAGVALMALAGIQPAVAVDLEILDEDGEMARGEAVWQFARRFGLKVISVADIANHVASLECR